RQPAVRQLRSGELRERAGGAHLRRAPIRHRPCDPARRAQGWPPARELRQHMAILAIIFGILLILFGGGCTLIVGGIMVSDPSSIINDLGTTLSILLPLGLLPLAIGI